MTTPPVSSLKPYKFLDHYGFEDREIFFGRERETEILLSDVIATRLVVLFAKTGSGKSSLINAGVRPRLEDLDYSTFYVRVEKDPIASLQKILRDSNMPLPDPQLPLDVRLQHIAEQIQKPIVLFFDQFEEFFIYILQDQPEIAKQFVSDVARLYRNRDSSVHMVFSMREEFFVEMDIFRDEIPSIFHSDSNLRLRWFDAEQAHAVIVKPARRFDTHVEEKLVKRLIQDLQQGGWIEPAKLQIVCDTLWQQRSDTNIILKDYERLGGAERILDRRLVQDITINFDDEMLHLLEKLLPELITDRGTKYVRGFEELAKNLQWDPGLLEKLVEQLSALGLVRSTTQSGTRFFEWTSDYVAERTTRLEERVRTVLLTRQLQSSMDKARIQADVLDQTKIDRLTYEQRDGLYLSDEVFENFSASAKYLQDLDGEQGEFLFLAALEHGDHMQLWFEQAAARGVPVWDVIKDRITNKSTRLEQAENAVRLLGELKNEQAVEMLKAALENDFLSSLTVKVLGRMNTMPAFRLLENALKQDALAPLVLPELAQSGNSRAVDLLQEALQHPNLAQQAERELDRISRGRSSLADHAGQVLEKWKAESQPQPKAEPQHQPLQPAYGLRKSIEDRDWDLLLRRIQAGKSTLFIGPGILAGVLPSQDEIAKDWAKIYNYPLEDADNLARVATFLAVQYDSMYPKEILLKNWFQSSTKIPDFNSPQEPHAVLAGLPVSIYMTTNYDPFMTKALEAAGKKPRRELCRWNNFTKDYPSIFDQDPGFEPSPEEPVVFHLYGHDEYPESLVLTEDDYLDFLVSISRDYELLPHQVRRSLSATSLLFLGYGGMDWGFRILFRGLVTAVEKSLRRISLIVQNNYGDNEISRERESYLAEYFNQVDNRVYWGTLREFTTELRQRWEDFR